MKTLRTLVHQAMSEKAARKRLLRDYEDQVSDYLRHVLNQQKLIPDEAGESQAIDAILAELRTRLPEKLSTEWGPGVRFRDLLREAVHEAIFTWSCPAARERLCRDLPAWVSKERQAVLDYAWDRLRVFEESKQERGSRAFTVLKAREENPGLTLIELSERLGLHLGGADGDATSSLRKALSRASDRFGRYLIEGITERFPAAEEDDEAYYRDLLEDLGLMDYALRSPYCRSLLDLDGEEL
ncbi:hypothetical protein [Tautonia marina]|uniref:hypothetical protein n=1 Tax=Tautonia marina TaxID=2653855 RepID=UPI001260BD58|nr:hypothetical protein [Tautonia marina]